MKPLLASAVKDFEKLNWPMIASPKLDGIRCLITREGAVSRSLKPIPNHHARNLLNQFPIGYDGEILTYTDGKMDPLNIVHSKVMSEDGAPDFIFHIFDDFEMPNAPYKDRYPQRVCHSNALIVPTQWLYSNDMLLKFEEECLSAGYEGVMLRNPDGPYKFGRSTEKEQILLKVKRFFDSEAVVIGKIEQMKNNNAPTVDNLGHMERSSHKAGLEPKGTLGALKCRWLQNQVEFEIGTGMNDEQRQQFWDDPDLLGKLVTFKFQREGPNGRPLLPVFKAFRSDL